MKSVITFILLSLRCKYLLADFDQSFSLIHFVIW